MFAPTSRATALPALWVVFLIISCACGLRAEPVRSAWKSVLNGGSVRNRILAGALLAGAFCAFGAHAAGTDIVRKPAKWRGTLLEGTDALIATEKYGYPLFIQSGETVGRQFEPKPVASERLVAEFKRLCLDTGFDAGKLTAAASSSSFAFTNRKFVVTARKTGATFAADVWQSPEARLQVWNGDTAALAGKGTQSRWRNGATLGGFRSKDVLSPACNLTVMTTDIHDARALVAAMTAMTGAPPVKSVVKTQWADGNWRVMTPTGPVRIFYSMTDLDRAEQLVHIAATGASVKD